MKLFKLESPSVESLSIGFDQLRSRLESDIERPTVVAIIGATCHDGVDVTTRKLAESLASVGYSTLLIQTTLGDGQPMETSFDRIADSVLSQPTLTGPMVMNVTNATQHRNISRRAIELAFEELRRKFDYVVVGAEYEAGAPFATSIIGAANAVFVTIQKGRRERSYDISLSEVLSRQEVQFVGVVALDKKIIAEMTEKHTRKSSRINVRREARKTVAEAAKRSIEADPLFG